MTTLDNTPPAKKTINLADLMKRPEIQKAYMNNKTRLSTDDIVDRLIHITKAEFKTEESPKSHGQVEFMYLHFIIDGDKAEKYIKTQSIALKERIKAIPPEIFKDEDVVCMIKCTQQGVNRMYYFYGTDQ